MSKRTTTVLVTGDVVLDCHLYGGASGGGTRYAEVAGGAALTHSLLAAAADLDGTGWEQAKQAWEAANRKRKQDGQPALPRPDGLARRRPPALYESHLGISLPASPEDYPTHLRSYGVWTARARCREAKDKVWRIASDFGYGPLDEARAGFRFSADPEAAAKSPDLVVIDDGGLWFRHGTAQSLWPKLDPEGKTWYLLKLSRPLCCGDLWEALDAVKDRLIVVVAAGDLRRQDIQINTRLSWEQSAEHTLTALLKDPLGRELCHSAAHVIVTFGSAGALWVQPGATAEEYTARLLLDPLRLEGEIERGVDGTTYGFQTCFIVAVAHHLATAGGLGQDAAARDRALETGIGAGLLAKRTLLELGHGPADSPPPGLPVSTLAQALTRSPQGITTVGIPHDYCDVSNCQWTILTQLERSPDPNADPHAPLIGLGLLTARYGANALSAVPALRLGKLHTVDRADIESLRTLEGLIREYEAGKVQKKPLCLGVFGPPGAGKSFGVRALAESILGPKVPFLEFNLSQFSEPEELAGAFHRVRDAVLQGITPVAFWDEFDARGYFWLQYLLAPMQDGSFQQGEINHPLGKCIFVFAGGTAPTYDTFGVAPPPGEPAQTEAQPPAEPLQPELTPAQQAAKAQADREQKERYRQYQLLKGPDFVSRLHGFLNVLGPNPRQGTDCVDNSWPIRRALLLRGMLGLGEDDELDMDPGLLYALLTVSKYHFGARSFERLVKALAGDHPRQHLSRSGLPPHLLLDRDTPASEFAELLVQLDVFRLNADLETLAAAVNTRFYNKWGGQPDFNRLPPDKKASNRAAARRLPDHLALIGYVVVAAAPNEPLTWQVPLRDAIEHHVDRLAQAEHLGWMAERRANGWTYSPTRNDALKQHPLLVPWSKLPLAEREKDLEIARWIPDILEIAHHKAVPVASP